MKKNYAILKEYSLALALLISTIFILHSCKKEPKRNSNDIKIEEAKLWLSQQKNAGAFDFDWNTARQIVGAKGSVFILPLPSLTYNGKTITYNNLYIYKDDEGAVTGSVMYYMPEKGMLPIEV